MNATRRSAVFAALLALSAPVATVGDEPDALDILKKADAATKAVKAFSYKAEFRGTGDIADRIPTIKGTVMARQARPGVLGLVFGAQHGRPSQRIKGEWTPPGTKNAEPFEIASDGKQAVLIDAQRKIAVRGELPEAEGLLKTGQPLYMIELLHPTPFTDEITAKETRYEGVKDVEGVACDVVFVVYRTSDIDSRWYIGRADSLPRRVERIYDKLGRSGSMVLTLSDLVIAPSLVASDFAPPTPKGFRTKTFRPPLKLGQRAPSWTLSAPDEQTVSLKSLRGQVVVLGFWATWCDYCKQSMPAMQTLHERYAGQRVKVFGVDCWETDGDPVAYMKSKHLGFPILLRGDKVADQYRVNGLPAFFVIDPQGRIVYIGSGMLQDREMTQCIEKAAAGLKSRK